MGTLQKVKIHTISRDILLGSRFLLGEQNEGEARAVLWAVWWDIDSSVTQGLWS